MMPSGQGGKYPEGYSFCVFKMPFPRWSCQFTHHKSLWQQLSSSDYDSADAWRTQGVRPSAALQQTQEQLNKSDPDVMKFMKDVKLELSAIRTLMIKLEVQLISNRKRKQENRRGKPPDSRKARLKVRRGRQHRSLPR